jgi:hypothetical protein
MENKQNALIAGLAIALVLALVVIAYLLGQRAAESRSSPAALQATAAVDPPQPGAGAPSPLPSSAVASPAPSPEPSKLEVVEGFGGEEPSAAPAQPAGPEATERIERRENGEIVIRSAGTGDTDKIDIKSYFQRVAEIQVGGTDTAGFAEAFMERLKTSVTTGDLSPIDELIKNVDKSTRAFKQLDPPEACAEYHQKALESLSETRALLKDLRTGIGAKDMSLLGTLAGQAQQLQAKADELTALEKALKARAR